MLTVDAAAPFASLDSLACSTGCRSCKSLSAASPLRLTAILYSGASAPAACDSGRSERKQTPAAGPGCWNAVRGRWSGRGSIARYGGFDRGVWEDVVASLGHREDVLHESRIRFVAARLQPVHDVGLARHEADLDRLLLAEPAGWDAGVDAIGEMLI